MNGNLPNHMLMFHFYIFVPMVLALIPQQSCSKVFVCVPCWQSSGRIASVREQCLLSTRLDAERVSLEAQSDWTCTEDVNSLAVLGVFGIAKQAFH